MRDYGQVQCSFWQHASERRWSNQATLLALYLLTGPHSNGIGCYRLTDGYVADDLGWSSETVAKGFAELFEDGFCQRFGTVVFIPGFLRWNAISNGNVATARNKEFEAIPNDEAKAAVARAMLEFGAHWSAEIRGRLEGFAKGFAEPYAKQKPNLTKPEPNQNQESTSDEVLAVGKPTAPTCPHSEIVALYHEVLPQLPAVRIWDTDRQQLLRSRWREAAERQTLDWWRGFFEFVGRCPFLLGEPAFGDRDSAFQADLEWLVRPKNFRKVIEGRYQPRSAAA